MESEIEFERNFFRNLSETLNKERAIAVKALQEIKDYLCAPKNDYQAIVKAFMTASVALEELGEEE